MGELLDSLRGLAGAFLSVVFWGFVAHALGLGVLWWVIVVVAVVLILAGRAASTRPSPAVQPWPWPDDFFVAVGRLGRPIDPTPKRVLPLTVDASVARVAATHAGIAELTVRKPQFWPSALLTSILVQRRNAVLSRLRICAVGYQPLSGASLRPNLYTLVVAPQILEDIETRTHVDQFMVSPAFLGAFGEPRSDENADADAVVDVANRLMDFHDKLLRNAELTLRMTIDADSVGYARDVAAYVLSPLVEFDAFILTLCDRVAEVQELMPYLHGDTELEPAVLNLDVPDGLMENILAHKKSSDPPARR